MSASERLSRRLDELASAVHRAGVRSDASTRLLELAALATMRALELDLHTAQRHLPKSTQETRPAAREPPPLHAAA